LIAGIERADSIAFDLHKWMSMPYDIGCVLVRSAKQHYETFTLTPDYLAHGNRGLAGAEIWFSDYGLELTRPFRALKAWMLIKEHGTGKYARLMEQSFDQALHVRDLVEAAPELELLSEPSLMIICFRYRAGGATDEQLDALNEELVFRIQEQGIAVPSGTRIRDRYAIRMCILNHRTEQSDLDLTVREVIRIGDELRAEMLGR